MRKLLPFERLVVKEKTMWVLLEFFKSIDEAESKDIKHELLAKIVN